MKILAEPRGAEVAPSLCDPVTFLNVHEDQPFFKLRNEPKFVVEIFTRERQKEKHKSIAGELFLFTLPTSHLRA